MAMKLSREGRWLDIVEHIHREQLLNNTGATCGHYCSRAGLKKSPYMINEFRALVEMEILIMMKEPYKATVQFVYFVNYEVVKKDYPQIYQSLSSIGIKTELPLSYSS